MSDIQKIDLRRTGQWLAGTVEIRVPRGWLVAAALAAVALLAVALD